MALFVACVSETRLTRSYRSFLPPMKLRVIFALALVSAIISLPSRAQIVWNFGTTVGSDSPSSNDASNLTVSVISQNNNNGSTTMLSSSSSSSGYTGSSGQYNAASSGVAGALNLSTSTYYQLTLTPTSGYEVSLSSFSFGTRSTGSGPTNVAVYTSSDNYTASIASGTSTSTWGLVSSGELTSITGTSSSPLVIRIYGYGGSGSTSTANWRIDDVSVSAVSAVPESSTYAAILGGVALLGVLAVRRRKRSTVA